MTASSPSECRSKTADAGRKDQRPTKWRTAAQQRVYGRRLLDALRATAGGGARAVKAAADSALALTARGQSRWSRSILLLRRRRRRNRLKFLPIKDKTRSVRGRTRPASSPRGRDRLRLLRRLVPGCRKLSAPSVLEEAADYVAALEMQVKAMRALADAFSGARAAAAAEAQRGA
ncbi:transcription factor bHLH149-like [Curcuma longa]|uniref:transcription factor bHLH149-like n=1 Tax=Curcuma longa TaxID=136217 RepID=UPI003D9ED27D